MNKNRLEALSDGVFSILMTLLVFEISLPALRVAPTNALILADLATLIPLFVSYFISFAVLAMFWISHNFFYHSFTREVNRTLVLLNMAYLAALSLIPFSAKLLGEYDYLQVAVVAYGINVLVIGILAATVLHYAIFSDEIDISHVSPRLLTQARIRSLLTPTSALIGILVSMVSVHVALFFFALPIIFMVPGVLTATEKMFGLEF
ncbi:DUF1211 domain-containing protein [Candidatus Kaiserbacteria bacterium]|nr:DUF1211 domain-containing protein [Candidatus Kaiserbacteria bacterium]